MYDVRVQVAGGSWATDLSTGSRRYALSRRDELRHPARRRRKVVQVLDHAGRPVSATERA